MARLQTTRGRAERDERTVERVGDVVEQRPTQSGDPGDGLNIRAFFAEFLQYVATVEEVETFLKAQMGKYG